MEEGAHVLFKVPPPGIEFTLPSPKIGIESLEVVDSPWELLVKTKVEEVTINQERHVRLQCTRLPFILSLKIAEISSNCHENKKETTDRTDKDGPSGTRR